MKKLYKAIDRLNGTPSLFLVKGEKMAVSRYCGDDDPWLNKKRIKFKEWVTEDLNFKRMKHKVRVW